MIINGLNLKTLPVINLAELDQDDKTRASFYSRLRNTARNIGFFYLLGHGIEAERFQRVQQLAKRFFALTEQEKQQIHMRNSPHFRGYTAVREELTYGQQDYREQIDIGPELEAIKLDLNSPYWLQLQGPNQWPQNFPEFKLEFERWQKDLRKIAIKLLRAFMCALDLPENSLDSLVLGVPSELMKVIHYPGSDDVSQKQGVGPHKDSGILTLLLTDDVGGLEVKTGNTWIEVPPLENAFVINIGEVLELATNGYLRANIHRVVSPKNKVDRYSIAYFITPNLYAGEIPLLNLSAELNSLALGPESDPNNPLFRNIGDNSLKSRLRSHQEVTKRFYPQQYQEIFGKKQRNIST